MEIKYRAPHAIDATLSPSGNLNHWLISTQVDANIVLDAGDLSPAYLLQDCGAVRIILPLRVARELDGLKSSSDDDVARRARRANAFFSDPWIRRQPGLEREQGAGEATNRTADEEILDVALAAQKEGATVLCTRDTVWKATGGLLELRFNFRTGATRT